MSTSVGILQKFSKVAFVASPAFIAVPHATTYILLIVSKNSFDISKSLKDILLSDNLEPIVSLIAFGCS